jgi:hypothetical protein
MSGYFTQDGTDLSNIFKPITSPSTPLYVIDSTGTGITITSNSGPLIIQQNTLTQPINMITAVASTATINLSQNSIPIISVATSGITIKSPSNTTVMVINDGAICSTNFNYGTTNITPTAGSTYVLLVSSPKELYITGANSFTLTFPTSPPNGTNYRIIRSAITGTLSLSGGTFYDGTNTVITGISSYMMKFVYYSGAWYTCRF